MTEKTQHRFHKEILNVFTVLQNKLGVDPEVTEDRLKRLDDILNEQYKND